MMKRWTMALRYMLAASAPWYLPALFLACLSWAMAFQVLDVVRPVSYTHLRAHET